MFDIKFYKDTYPIKEKITKGKISAEEFELIEKELETFRDKSPTIFNIETTNYCNMKCVMLIRASLFYARPVRCVCAHRV